MKRPSVRPYLVMLGTWLVVSGLGCVVGAAADGLGSILPNFLIYGVGVGAGIAVLLLLAYLWDMQLYRRNAPPADH